MDGRGRNGVNPGRAMLPAGKSIGELVCLPVVAGPDTLVRGLGLEGGPNEVRPFLRVLPIVLL